MYSRTNVANRRRGRSGSSKEPITSQELRAYELNYSPLFSQRPFPSHADRRYPRIRDLAVFGGNELGNDAHRDLLRRNRTDVEADRRVNSLERFRGSAFLQQRIEDASDFRFAANEAEV